jgi:DNA-binding NarL/FixJ family response regulator
VVDGVSPVIPVAGTDPTEAELAALRAYIAAGSVKGAAYQLGLSPSTIKQHLQNVRSRMGAKTTTEAAVRLAHHLAG